jgi:hypothetical protein
VLARVALFNQRFLFSNSMAQINVNCRKGSGFPVSRLAAASFHHLGSRESRQAATPTLIYHSFSLVGTTETRFDRRIRDSLLDFIQQGFGLINIHDA